MSVDQFFVDFWANLPNNEPFIASAILPMSSADFPLADASPDRLPSFDILDPFLRKACSKQFDTNAVAEKVKGVLEGVLRQHAVDGMMAALPRKKDRQLVAAYVNHALSTIHNAIAVRQGSISLAAGTLKEEPHDSQTPDFRSYSVRTQFTALDTVIEQIIDELVGLSILMILAKPFLRSRNIRDFIEAAEVDRALPDVMETCPLKEMCLSASDNLNNLHEALLRWDGVNKKDSLHDLNLPPFPVGQTMVPNGSPLLMTVFAHTQESIGFQLEQGQKILSIASDHLSAEFAGFSIDLTDLNQPALLSQFRARFIAALRPLASLMTIGLF